MFLCQQIGKATETGSSELVPAGSKGKWVPVISFIMLIILIEYFVCVFSSAEVQSFIHSFLFIFCSFFVHFCPILFISVHFCSFLFIFCSFFVHFCSFLFIGCHRPRWNCCSRSPAPTGTVLMESTLTWHGSPASPRTPEDSSGQISRFLEGFTIFLYLFLITKWNIETLCSTTGQRRMEIFLQVQWMRLPKIDLSIL